jgi:hypothetical protein
MMKRTIACTIRYRIGPPYRVRAPGYEAISLSRQRRENVFKLTSIVRRRLPDGVIVAYAKWNVVKNESMLYAGA